MVLSSTQEPLGGLYISFHAQPHRKVFHQGPLCSERSRQLLCGCCCGAASEENEILEGTGLSTDSGLIVLPYSSGPMTVGANMPWPHTPVIPEFGSHRQEDSRFRVSCSLSFLV